MDSLIWGAIGRRSIALLFLWLLTAVHAFASSAIILMSPVDAGPNVDPMTYSHPNWILWPPATVDGGSNRLLSLMSGQDWRVSGLGGAPIHQAGGWILPSQAALHECGYVEAVKRQRHPARCLLSESGSIAPNALLLAVQSKDLIVPQKWSDPITTNETLTFEAHSWDELTTLVRRISGKAIVVEYPPLAGQNWSRVWRYENGKRIDDELIVLRLTNFPGLIPASDALKLLEKPPKFGIQRVHLDRLEDANRWLNPILHLRPVLLGLWAMLAFCGFVIASVSMMREQRSRTAQCNLIGALTFGPAILLGSKIAWLTSVNAFPIWTLVLWIFIAGGIYAASVVSNESVSTPRLIWSVAVTGLVSMFLVTPAQSMLSGVLEGRPGSMSPEAVGIALGVFILSSLGWPKQLFRGLCMIGFLCAFLPEMMGFHGLAPVFAALFVCTFAEFRWWWMVVIGFEPLVFAEWIRESGLRAEYADARLMRNEYAAFFLSPAFLGVVTATGIVTLFGDRFFVHQLRRMSAADPQYGQVGRMCVACGLVALTHPPLLTPVLVAGLIGFGGVVYACVRDL